MWRVVVARSDDNSTLLSSEITSGAVAPGHLSTLPAPPSGHHWGYPPPPHHPPYQPSPQHPDMRHHHDMRPPASHGELRHAIAAPGTDLRSQELRHEMQRPDLRHPAEMQRHQELSRHQELPRHQDVPGMRPELPELRSNHEFLELKIDTELRSQDNGQQQQQPQQQQSQQNQGHQQRNLKRTMSDSDCDDVFSEESGKEPYVYLFFHPIIVLY